MIFQHNNGALDTNHIEEHEAQRFSQHMDYLYRQIEDIVNPRRCVNLTDEVIAQRVALMTEQITGELALTDEQIQYVLSFRAGRGIPPVENF